MSTSENGPGKYDALCTYVREQTNAGTVVLIILEGDDGHGFSVQTNIVHSRTFLPDLLETVAADIRANWKEIKPDESTLPPTTG